MLGASSSYFHLFDKITLLQIVFCALYCLWFDIVVHFEVQRFIGQFCTFLNLWVLNVLFFYFQLLFVLVLGCRRFLVSDLDPRCLFLDQACNLFWLANLYLYRFLRWYIWLFSILYWRLFFVVDRLVIHYFRLLFSLILLYQYIWISFRYRFRLLELRWLVKGHHQLIILCLMFGAHLRLRPLIQILVATINI